jgi:hypothetical protein
MTKFGGKWDRVNSVEHCERDSHSADADVGETLDLVNAACTAWLAKKGLLLSWESYPATNPACSLGPEGQASLLAGVGAGRPRQLGNPRAVDGDLNA